MKKTVLITGTSSGIGKATALEFHRKGWNVIATMRSPEKESELTNLENALVVALDVQNQESIDNAIEEGIKKFGKIDAIVNNAGYTVFGPFELTTDDQISRIFDTNLYGPMRVLRSILPLFREQKSGVIINVTSAGGRVTYPITSIYHATKFALEGFTETLAYELIPFGIQTKIVEPGSTATKFVGSAEITTGDNPIYDEFIHNGLKNWEKHDTLTSSPETIADKIFTAATDNNYVLRYPVGEDTEFYLAIRQSIDDQSYVDFMRNRFIPEYLNN
ncbi:SDR family oxidoreductase [Sphingobacterium rhinopitheci]|uniref:SDR family oxidoreductase n=1 Tax=Sphingobacterium rhinopitheci TaxID=2781960 RepID=UPI001F528233|nr:SDR family oxidoreductase [Sphingobacterium rhinopitheci]MCI0922536.1 SDR family oxidoreductase [Sphingobacterium rhinopitheci]